MTDVRTKASWWACLVLSAIVAGAACGNGGGHPRVAATVEGMKIQSSDTEGLVDAYLQRHISDPQQQNLPRQQVTKFVIGYQIRLALLEHLATTMGISDQNEAELNSVVDLVDSDSYGLLGERKDDYVDSLRAGRLSKAIAQKLYPNIAVSDSELQDEYARRAPLLDRHWKATTKVATFTAQGFVDQLRARVGAGEPFEQAANALGAKGVGTVDVNPLTAQLGAPVLDAIGKTQLGQVSQAVPVGKEFVAVDVVQRQDLPRLTVDDLRAELTDALVEQQRYRRFQDWFDHELGKAKIAVDHAYGKWSSEYTRVT
jgi:hypothetical protein